MGKRSDFARVDRDCYDTPSEAVAPLVPHLPDRFTYWEPCAGSGALVDALPMGDRVWMTDIEPRGPCIGRLDALTVHSCDADLIITNPPWRRDVLHPMIEHFSAMRPTWLLFDADWMHTRQAAPFMPWLRKIVSVGRVKWIKDSPHTGKDNCAWYLFDREGQSQPIFFGREQAHGTRRQDPQTP